MTILQKTGFEVLVANALVDIYGLYQAAAPSNYSFLCH